MRRVSLCTFFVFATVLFILSQVSYGNSFVKIEYCRLFDPGVSKNQEVLTEATLYVSPEGEPRVDGSDSYFYSLSCNNRDFFALADFSAMKNREILDTQLLPKNLQNSSPRFKVKMRGKIIVNSLPSYGALSWLRAEFRASNLQSVTLIKDEEYPASDTEADAPIMDTTSALRSINAGLMPVLFGFRKAEEDRFGSISNSARFYLNRRTVELNQLKRVTSAPGEAEMRIDTSNVSQNRRGWIIRGRITFKQKDGKQFAIRYENLFLKVKNNSFILGRANFWKG